MQNKCFEIHVSPLTNQILAFINLVRYIWIKSLEKNLYLVKTVVCLKPGNCLSEKNLTNSLNLISQMTQKARRINKFDQVPQLGNF